MFLTPGDAYVGRKGQRGKGDTSLIQSSWYTASQTITIPRYATRARVLMVGATGGGGGGFFCPCLGSTNGGQGGGTNPAAKLLTALTPGQTLALTIGARGTGGGGGLNGTAGGTTSLASGTQIITTLQITGGGGGIGTNSGSGVGASGVATGFDYTLTEGFFALATRGAGTGGIGGNGTAGHMFIEWEF